MDRKKIVIIGCGGHSNNLIEKLIDNKISVRPFWQPIHLQKPYKNFQIYKLGNILEIYKKGLHLPSSVSLAKKDIILISSIITEKI